MKKIILYDEKDIEKYIELIRTSANKAKDIVDDIADSNNGINVLKEIKYKQIGFDPLDSERSLNLIEQVNQTFTYLASLEAAKFLFSKHELPNGIRLNLGTLKGSDIETLDGKIKAEVFAATSPRSNQKLKKDVSKVKSTSAQIKYVFFSCPEIPEGPYQYKDETEVIIWSLGIKT